jgi:membrane protease YdiL (CAAX protease family)
MKKALILMFSFIIIQLGLGVFEILIVVLCTLAGYKLDAATPVIVAYSMIFSYLLMIGFMYFIKEFPEKKEEWSFTSFPFILLVLLAGVSTYIVNDGLAVAFSWLPNIAEDTENQLLGSPLGIISICVIGPICEELIFRGGITRDLLKQYNPMKAIIISSLIFSIVHFNPAQMLPAFVVGIILALIYYWSKSVIPGMIIHIMFNSFTVILMNDKLDSFSDIVGTSTFVIMLVNAVFFLFFALYLMKRVIDKRNKKLAANESQQPISNS